ncbi:hypothetical protein EYF80_019592 [Liparis tanakae]|uniref:Uncharacterized protein n=1 Tax=Liparis tanakae TaxID=230148 RepID=A0A4Z2HXC4_9TELE|nr:hypothetical protein EYF80_019592 [Liparis tanakae]
MFLDSIQDLSFNPRCSEDLTGTGNGTTNLLFPTESMLGNKGPSVLRLWMSWLSLPIAAQQLHRMSPKPVNKTPGHLYTRMSLTEER